MTRGQRAGSEVRGPTSEVRGPRSEVRRRTPRPAPRRPDRLLLGHERVAIVARRREGFLQGSRADPAYEVQLGPRLVVRAGSARAAERLLTDDRAGGLVVDIEIPGGVPERAERLPDTRAIAAEHGAGQRVWRRLVDDLERLFPLAVGIHVGRHDR